MSISRQPPDESAAARDVSTPAGAVLLRPLVQEIVNLAATTTPERSAADTPLIVVDVDRSHTIDADPGIVRRVIAALIRDAVAAASGAIIDTDVPVRREVVITSVRTPAAIDIEIADSSAAAPDVIGMATTSARQAVERLGGSLRVHRCPEGGRAVTLSFPRQASRQQAGGGLRRAA